MLSFTAELSVVLTVSSAGLLSSAMLSPAVLSSLSVDHQANGFSVGRSLLLSLQPVKRVPKAITQAETIAFIFLLL